MKIDSERLARVMQLPLGVGAHDEHDIERGMCVMEATAYVAGEDWSDKPACVSLAIATFLRSLNDTLPDDATRDRLLKPLIPLVVGTATTPEDEQRRAFMAMDWLVRVWTPKWLELLPALAPHAIVLREYEEICDAAGLVAATAKLNAARDASAAAMAAARDAAMAAAMAAAGTAAAWAAAWDYLKPTVEWCQQSAVELVTRMCEVGRSA